MQTFRAYLLDERGKIRLGDWIEAANGNEALEKARLLWRDAPPRIEVWFGAEKLCQEADARHSATPIAAE